MTIIAPPRCLPLYAGFYGSNVLESRPLATAPTGVDNVPVYPRQSPQMMGMYIFLASEVMFFGTLFGSYFYLLASHNPSIYKQQVLGGYEVHGTRPPLDVYF